MNIEVWLGALASLATIIGAFYAGCHWIVRKLKIDYTSLSTKIEGIHVELKEDMQKIRDNMQEIRGDRKKTHDRIDSSLVRIDRMYEILIQEIASRRTAG